MHLEVVAAILLWLFWGESRDWWENSHWSVCVDFHFACVWQESSVKFFFSLCRKVCDFLQNMHIKNLNILELTLVPPQSDLTSTGLAEVHLQPPGFPEFPFSVSEPVICRMLQKTYISYTLSRETAFLFQMSPGDFSSWRRVVSSCWLPCSHLQHVLGGGGREGQEGTWCSGSVVQNESARLKEKGNPPNFLIKSQEVIGGGNGTVTSVLSLWNWRCSLRN